MKRNLIIGILFIILNVGSYAQVAVNTNGNPPNISAMLDISSTAKGLLIPSMTTDQRTTIVTPANGLLVYDTNTGSFWYYNGTATEWQKVGNSVAGATQIDDLSDGNTTGNSVFLGTYSGFNDDGTNNSNTALGNDALRLNVSGDNNTAVGYSALKTNTANGNAAFGSLAMNNNTTGFSNVAVGRAASYYNTTGNYNVSIGMNSNVYNQEGSQNTIVGHGAGSGLVTHSKSGNIFLGYQAGYSESSNNKLYIQNSNATFPLIYGDFDLNTLGFNADVGIGTQTPQSNLHIMGSATLASLLLSPNESASGDDSEILFGEDDDNTYGMSIKYDGGDNNLYFYGKSDATITDPLLTIKRSGNVGIGTINPTDPLVVVSTGNIGTSSFSGQGIGISNATIYSDNTSTGGIAGYFQTAGTDATIVLKQTGTGKFLKAFGPNGGNEEWSLDNSGMMEFYNSNGNKTIEIDPSESGTTDAGQMKFFSADGLTTTIEIDGSYNGDGRIITNELQITGGSDLSEFFELTNYGVIEKGMVVSIDENNPGQLKITTTAFDKKVAGIVSGANEINPGLIMSQKGTIADGEHLIALSGRVYCLADATTRPIDIGDMLTTSNVAGHAMKVTNYNKAQGAIIGKAMTSLESGKGLVLVLVSLQ